MRRLLRLFHAWQELEEEAERNRVECAFWKTRAQEAETQTRKAQSELVAALKRIADEQNRIMTGRHIFADATAQSDPAIGGQMSGGRMQARQLVNDRNREFAARMLKKYAPGENQHGSG